MELQNSLQSVVNHAILDFIRYNFLINYDSMNIEQSKIDPKI